MFCSFINRLNKLSKRGRFIVGLTGIIGSGKTTALRFFNEFGAFTISSDEIVRNILTQEKYYSIILTRYPKVADVNNKIDRKLLADLIFSNKKAKRFIEGVIHPAVISNIEKRLSESSYKIAVVEVPLLFEVALESAFDLNICVASRDYDIIKRLKDRGMSYTQIKDRLKFQLSQKFKMKKSDLIIFNFYSLDVLRMNVKYIFDALIKIIENKNVKI